MLSVLLHGTLLGLLVYGFWSYKASRPPKPTLAIEATVVDPKTVTGADTNAPTPAPPPPAPPAEQVPPEPTGPPPPSPEELAQREQALKDQADKERAQKEQAEVAEKQRRLEEEQQQEEQARGAEEKRKAQEKADADRKAAEAKKKAEEQRQAEQKRQEAAQRAADEQARADREADLKNRLAAEEHSNATRSSAAMASWEAQITARIQRAWLRPPSARPGTECVLHVTQVPGGAVVNAQIGTCNGDQAVRESIEAAAYRASPLPPPPDPAMFERNLDITFKPD